MGKINALLHSFNNGEISKNGLVRIDQEKVRLCAEVQENLFPYTIGKAIMRPGSKYLGTLSSSTAIDNTPRRILPFVKSITEKAILELGYDTEGAPTNSTSIFTTVGHQHFIVPDGATTAVVRAVGAGANGAAADSGGGGGGAYASSTISVTPGATMHIFVGNAGSTGEDSWVNIIADMAPTTTAEGCLAKGGTVPTGGQASACIGTTKYSGGNGGAGGSGADGGDGGGGAAGPSGAGKNGGSFFTEDGGGGGGSNGGSSTAGADSAGGIGGNGGHGTGGTGGGAGGTGACTNGANGTAGGGGGGATGQPATCHANGGNGGSDTAFASTHGCGGGGGGASDGAGSGVGGTGGLYGGGGGGSSGTGSGSPGLGARGIVVITFTYTGLSGRLKVWVSDTLVTYPAVSSTIGDLTTFTTVLTGGAAASLAVDSFTAAASYNGGSAIVKKQITTASANIEHAISITIDRGTAEFRIGSTDGDDDYFSTTRIGPGTHILSFTPAGSYWVRFLITSDTTFSVTDLAIFNSTAKDLAVPAPWIGGALRPIRYDQSLDVVFLTIPSAQPYKIERRSNRSWSVVKYLAVDGPFQTSRNDPTVRLKPAATHGDTTLTADREFFTTAHVGALFKLTHDNFNATFGLAATGFFTQAWKQTGIGTDRAFSVTVSGTWVGTINIQRSFVDEFSGFSKYGADITINGTTNVAGATEDANAIVWYRVIFTTYTSGSATIAVAYPGYSSTGVCRVTSLTSGTVANVEVVTSFSDVVYTESWLQGEWNAFDGFPTAVALFDGRLWFARRDRFWGSVSDSYYSFDVNLVGDSAAIARAVATGGEFSDIQWMLPLQRLILGTSGAEASVRSSSLDEPLKATAITVKDGSTQGSANIAPIKIDGRGYFVQRSGRKLMELSIGEQGVDYTAVDLMRYNDELGTSLSGLRVPGIVEGDIIELASQRFPETYVWCLRDDGICPILLHNEHQGAMGWFRMIMGRSYTGTYGTGSGQQLYLGQDRIVSSAMLPGLSEDSVYLITQRRSGPDNTVSPGNPIYSYNMEKMVFHIDTTNTILDDATTNSVKKYSGLYQLDSYETTTVAADGVTVTASNRFANCEVMVIGPHYNSSGSVISYGPIGDTYTFSGNTTLTLSENSPYRAGAVVTVGLPYTGRYRSAKLAYGAQGGTALLQKKRVAQVGLILTDYHPAGVQIGSDFDEAEGMDDLPVMEDGAPVDLVSELISEFDGDMFAFPGIWDTDSRVCIKVKPGYSATLNGLVIGVETNER